MNFDDTPEEAAFRQEVRAWIAANAPKHLAEPLSTAGLWLGSGGRRHHGRGQGLAEEEVQRRLGMPALAQGIRRQQRHPDRAGDLGPGGGGLFLARRDLHHRPRHVRPDHIGLRVGGAEAPLSAAARGRRGGLVPAVQRTGRRLGSGGPAHPRREGDRRLRRLDHQRPEDLDLRRAILRLRNTDHAHRSDRAQAQGHDHVLPEHEDARDRYPADQAGQRPVRLTSSFHRRAQSPTPSGSARSTTAGRSRSPP